MNDIEVARQLKEAMRVYSFNSIGAELGVFQGIDKDGVTVKMKLEGNNLIFYPVEVPKVDVKFDTKTAEPPERVIPRTTRSRKDDFTATGT